MKKFVVLFLCSAAALQGCKPGNADATACKTSCERGDRQRAAIRKDIDAADAAATTLEQMPAGDEAEAKQNGQRALDLCDEIRSTLAHAHGIAWTLDDEQQAKAQASSRTSPPGADDAFGDVEKLLTTCRGDTSHNGLPLSPAQLKATIVPKVHALKGKYAADATCAATCERPS